MINSTQGTNFKSRICVSSQAYAEKRARDVVKMSNYVGYPWDMASAAFLKNEGYSDRAQTCTMGFIKRENARKFFLFHLDSGNEWANVKEGLLAAQKKLQRQDEKFQGFLIGSDYSFHRSKEQAKRLIDFFHETGVEFSAFLGHKEQKSSEIPYSNMFYSSPKDTIKIDFSGNKGIGSVEDFKSFYTDVIVKDDDEILIQ